jgi:hypothetical protein
MFSGKFSEVSRVFFQLIGSGPWQFLKTGVNSIPPRLKGFCSFHKPGRVGKGIVFARVGRNIGMTMNVFQMITFEIGTTRVPVFDFVITKGAKPPSILAISLSEI